MIKVDILLVALSKEVGQIEAGDGGKMTWKFLFGKKRTGKHNRPHCVRTAPLWAVL